MPRIRDAIRRTLKRRMHCPFIRDFDAFALRQVAFCLSLRNNIHISKGRKKRGGYALPLFRKASCSEAPHLGGSGWIDRFDANRSSGSVQHSSPLHPLVKEELRLFL